MKMKVFMLLQVHLLPFLLFGLAVGKICDNLLPDLDPNNPLPKYNKGLKVQDHNSWNLLNKRMRYPGMYPVPGDILKEMSLHDVRVGENSLHWRAQQTNLEYLLMLNVDNLVWSFRKTADLPTPGEPYGGWEDPNEELRGHFVGHYLSATAKMWASTHNDTIKQRMDAVVTILSECQKKIGSGYVSAFPSTEFDKLESLTPVWAPYYTIHKILAGLLDQFNIAGNQQALDVAKWMVDYFYNRIKNVITLYSVERHWRSLNDEHGGMNEFLYNLFSLTNDARHLLMAQLFDKPCFLGILALKADGLSGFHTNTHIPIIIGAQKGYEVTGYPIYREIAEFFLETVNSSHTYPTGGTSRNEHWTEPMRLADTLTDDNEESCTTYNMLKVSRNLFTWSKNIAYADYYERALTNGVLSIQRGTDPGVMTYFLPMQPGKSKALSLKLWGTPFQSFWCCYGTATESFSKLGDSIYFEEVGNDPGLYIIQYISSSVNWKYGKLLVNMNVDPAVSWDPNLRVTLNVTDQGAGKSSLKLRIPFWTLSNGAKATLNGQSLPLPPPGNYLSVTRKWVTGDTITLQLPITLRTEHIQDDRSEYASLHAILYGPYLLAGHSSGDWDIKTGGATSLSQWITAVPPSFNNDLVTFSQEAGSSSIILSNVNQSIVMRKKYFNISGTDDALHATFRLISTNLTATKYSSIKDVVGISVRIEPIDFPGMVVVHQGKDQPLGIKDAASAGPSADFRFVAGWDGKGTTVSLESESSKGCFVHNGGSNVVLNCNPQASNNNAASFLMEKGLSEYHPLSFVARGANRSFLLEPILSYRDEGYTVYFNIQA